MQYNGRGHPAAPSVRKCLRMGLDLSLHIRLNLKCELRASLLCLILIFLSGAVYGGPMENLEKNLKNHVIKLSKEIGERNYIYYDSLNKAADYITEKFKEYGYRPQIQSYNIGNRIYKNIIAKKTGNKIPQEIVIIGAHYDSVVGSPGANDNGSGVSTLLELSRLCSRTDIDKSIKFIAFVNEEPPFYLSGNMGSRVYAKDAKKRSEDIKTMISLETIGYYSQEPKSQSYPLFFYKFFYPDRANFIAVVGNFKSYRLVKRIKEAFKRNSTFNIESVVAPEIIPGVNFSDHDSFWKYGYQACMVTDTAFYRYPYYHTIEDTFEKIDYGKLTKVVKGLYYVLLELTR